MRCREVSVFVERFFRVTNTYSEWEEQPPRSELFPRLSDEDYELVLAIFGIYHTIPNANEWNNTINFISAKTTQKL